MNTKISLLVFLVANCILFFLSSCLPSAQKIEQKIERLKKADDQHQQMLRQKLDGETVTEQNVAQVKDQSKVTLTEGDISPPWVQNLPPECEARVYCGLAFVENCRNANSCRKEAETIARNDLRKNISVTLRSITSSRTYTELSAENESGDKTFQSEIRERGANIELKNVRFTHFYLRPEKQLQTLARMKRPEEAETKKETPEKRASGALPPLLLVFTDNKKNPNLNRKETQTLLQQRFTESLEKEKVNLLENGVFQNWESLSGNALRNRVSEELARNTAESVAVVLSLSGRLDPHEGQMFKGLATVFLTVETYGKENVLLFKKSFKARRFVVKSPDNLVEFQRQELFFLTVKKGLNEYENELVGELKQALSSTE